MSKTSLQRKTTIFSLFGIGLLFAGGIIITSSESSVATFAMATFVGLGIGIMILTVSMKTDDITKTKLEKLESKMDIIIKRLNERSESD